MAEQDHVELVDPDGTASGVALVSEAHAAPGLLHRAYSVQLVDGDGRLLLQRRAAVKRRFPGLWSNSTCGHPAPGTTLAGAARARVREELGVDVDGLVEVGAFQYSAPDAASGHVEREHDHVLVARFDGAPSPDPDEVSDVRWVTREEAAGLVAAGETTPWFAQVLELASPEVPARG